MCFDAINLVKTHTHTHTRTQMNVGTKLRQVQKESANNKVMKGCDTTQKKAKGKKKRGRKKERKKYTSET